MNPEYAPPNQGGCWFCHRTDGEMLFSIEFDTFVHRACLENILRMTPDDWYDPEAEIMCREFGITKETLMNDDNRKEKRRLFAALKRELFAAMYGSKVTRRLRPQWMKRFVRIAVSSILLQIPMLLAVSAMFPIYWFYHWATDRWSWGMEAHDWWDRKLFPRT